MAFIKNLKAAHAPDAPSSSPDQPRRVFEKSSREPSFILLAASYNPENRGVIDKRLEGYYTIQYMDRGAVELAYDDDYYLLEGQWFWPAYPGPRVVFHVAPGHDSWRHRHVGFSGELVFEWMEAGLWPTRPQRPPASSDFAALFDKVRGYVRRNDAFGRKLAVNLIEQILLELADERAKASTQVAPNPYVPEWLPRIIDRIADASESEYEGIARSEGMSPSTLRRHFRRAMGVSPHQYAIKRRIERARSLLVETDLPLKAIADSLGYENQFYFSTQFHEAVGVSPSQYRQSHRL